jgi:hypothetical protein
MVLKTVRLSESREGVRGREEGQRGRTYTSKVDQVLAYIWLERTRDRGGLVECGASEIWGWVNETRLAYCSTIVAPMGKMTSWRVVAGSKRFGKWKK